MLAGEASDERSTHKARTSETDSGSGEGEDAAPGTDSRTATTNRRATVARTDRRSHRVNSIEAYEANRRVEVVSTEADAGTGSRFMGSWGSRVRFKVQGSVQGFQEFVERLT